MVVPNVPPEADLFAPHALAEPGREQQVTQLDLGVVDGRRVLSGRRGRLLPRYLVVECEPPSPVVEPFVSHPAIEMPMVVGVAERLQAIDAGRLVAAGAGAGHRAGCVDDLREAFAQLVEQSRPAGHGIPQQRVDVVAVDVADHENLQVVQVHVEDLRGADPQRLQHAVRGLGAVAGRQRQHVRGCLVTWSRLLLRFEPDFRLIRART